MVLSLYSSALTYICGYSNTLCSLTTAFKSIPEPVQWFSLQNGVCFKYSAAWGFEDHGHSILVFCLVFLCNVISPDFILCPIMLPSFAQFTLCNTIFSVFSNPIIILRLYVTTIDLKWKIQDENEFDSVTSTKIINKALWNSIHFCTQMHIFRGLYAIGDWVRSCSTERCALFIHCLFVLFFQQLREFFPLPKEKHLHLEAVSVSSRPYLGCINKSNSQNNKLANQEYGRLWPKNPWNGSNIHERHWW